MDDLIWLGNTLIERRAIFEVLSEGLILIGLFTALLDMGMNGARYAGWAPYGLGMAALGLIIALF